MTRGSASCATRMCEDAKGVAAEYIHALVGRSTVDQIIRRLGEDGVSAGGDAVIDYVTAWKILHANVETSADEGHRLTNHAVPNGNFELLIASMMQGRNLTDGLHRMVAGARILRPDLEFRVTVNAGRPHLLMRFADGESLPQAVYIEALATVMHCAVCWGIGGDAAIERVRGSARIDDARGSWLSLLSDRVRREGEGATIIYGASAAEASFHPDRFDRWHEAAFAQYVRLVDARHQHRTNVALPVTNRVRALLIDKILAQDDVAHRLGMSVATLRRRLSEEGATFRRIQDALRRDMAQNLLLGDLSVDDIAEELGLSDSRCFRRACQTWFGGSPSEVRRALRELDRAASGGPVH